MTNVTTVFKNADEEKDSDEDGSLFLDCESVTERLLPVVDSEEMLRGKGTGMPLSGKVSGMSLPGTDQVLQLKEKGQGGKVEQNNIKRKKSWKRKKCLSLDTRRWDNAKDTISKGRKSQYFGCFTCRSRT